MPEHYPESLHHFTLCPLSRQVRLMAAELGININLIEVKPWEINDDILSLNAAGELPIWVTAEGKNISSIHALGEYLVERCTESDTKYDSTLLPKDLVARAEARRLVSWFNDKFNTEVSQPLLAQRVYQPFGEHLTDSRLLKLALQALRLHLEYIDSILRDRNWLGGDALSWSDFAASGHLSALDYIGDIEWNEFQNICSWYQRIKSRPCFRPLLKDWVAGVKAAASYADLDF